MTLKLEIPNDLEAGLLAQAHARGLSLEAYAKQVLAESGRQPVGEAADTSIADAARRLATFGKRHGLSLAPMTVKDLLRESRP
jgi:hypothetical protein